MPDILDANGLQVLTQNEIVVQLQDGMRSIYGVDINVDQNSPDGQWIGILAQMMTDIRELAVLINAGFDPDQAVGVVLDQRVAINNIQRAGGTFTTTPVSITVIETVTLQGLDEDFNNINGTGFTVQDDAGNQFILIDTDTLTPGTHSLNFRAKNIGQVEVVTGTIQTMVTVVLPVTAVNNPDGPLQIGQNEETDAQLRVRRQKSVALATTGYLNGLQGAILALPGVTDCALYENVSNSTDGDGIPAHGTWLVVEGGANTDIAQTYYERKSYGSNMKGEVEVGITTPSGEVMVMKFDRPTAENLYIRFDIQETVPNPVFDEESIKAYIVESVDYNIGESANTATLTAIALAAITASGGGGVPVNLEISKNGSNWFDYLTPTTKDKQFTLDVSRITITVL